MSALDAQLEKELQLTGAIDKAALRLQEEFESRIQTLREEMGDLIRSSVAAAPDVAVATGTAAVGTPGAPDSSLLLSAAETIDRTRSQTQVLAALLEGADGFASRAAVLLTRPENIQGWGSVGFEESGKKIEETRLSYRTGTPWGEMAGARGMVSLSPDQAATLCRVLGAQAPTEAVLIPIALADRTAAVLYADRSDRDETFDTAGLQLLATFAGLTLETLPLRRRASTPSLRHAAEASDQPGLAPWDPQGMTAAAKPAAEKSGEREIEPPAAKEPKAAAARPAAEVVDRASVERAEAAADAETAEIPVQPPKPKRSRGKRGRGRRTGGGGEIAAPSDHAGPGSAFAKPKTDDEESRKEDARRLARLLVSEIKLYNESKVAEALQQRNILVALSDEIDQSRKVYDQRVAAEIREDTDYFHDEVVRILAAGDGGALGN